MHHAPATTGVATTVWARRQCVAFRCSQPSASYTALVYEFRFVSVSERCSPLEASIQDSHPLHPACMGPKVTAGIMLACAVFQNATEPPDQLNRHEYSGVEYIWV